MISLDISILYQVVLFVVLWLILNKALFQPFLAALDARERRTSGAQHDSSELEHEGAKLRAEYEEKLARAQSAGASERERILQAARDQREKILGAARLAAQETLAQARSEVAAALTAERRIVAIEAANVGADIASKILGRKIG